MEPLVDGYTVEMNNGSVVNNKQSIKKSLPHKKRISKKLKKNASQTINDHDVPDVQEAIEIIEENVNQVHRVASHLIHNTTNAVIKSILLSFDINFSLNFIKSYFSLFL